MTPQQIERVYEALAEKLDAVGSEKSELFLAKLALLLSREIEDPARVIDLIHDAADNLDVAS